MSQTPFQTPIVQVHPDETVHVTFAAKGSGITLEFASVAEATLTFDAITSSLNEQAVRAMLARGPRYEA